MDPSLILEMISDQRCGVKCMIGENTCTVDYRRLLMVDDPIRFILPTLIFAFASSWEWQKSLEENKKGNKTICPLMASQH